jgi:type II secretory pathway predicted ATPase ExeA
LIFNVILCTRNIKEPINYIKVTSLSQRDLCREIANGINIKPSFELATLVRRIQECIEKRYSNNGIRSVLIFDDAHLIRPETLSLLSTLTNFEMDSELVLSVILVGQPFLGKLLQRDEMADVLYRMAYNCHLSLLSKNELNKYIKHRCHMASHSNVPFSDNSFEVLFELTQGNLRATDYLALKSLEVAHDEQSDRVNTSHVMTARSMLWT